MAKLRITDTEVHRVWVNRIYEVELTEEEYARVKDSKDVMTPYDLLSEITDTDGDRIDDVRYVKGEHYSPFHDVPGFIESDFEGTSDSEVEVIDA